MVREKVDYNVVHEGFAPAPDDMRILRRNWLTEEELRLMSTDADVYCVENVVAKGWGECDKTTVADLIARISKHGFSYFICWDAAEERPTVYEIIDAVMEKIKEKILKIWYLPLPRPEHTTFPKFRSMNDKVESEEENV